MAGLKNYFKNFIDNIRGNRNNKNEPVETTPAQNVLRAGASKNFDKYLNEFLTTGETHGLPNDRLTKEEWEQLNKELNDLGVSLIPKEQDGYVYYWFTNYVDKVEQFQSGKEEIENKLIEDIKAKYPGMSDIMILEILRSKDWFDAESVYQKIRNRQDGDYVDVSLQDFDAAFVYALESAGNKDTLFEKSRMHHWNPKNYKHIQNVGARKDTWPAGRNIIMSGTQKWTWFRSCDSTDKVSPVKDAQHPKGFHLSLNVNVCTGLLQALDDILIEDGGHYIDSYKFPKDWNDILRRYDPVTIYTYARNLELEQKIVKAVTPFVRSNDGMIGELLGKGVCINPETSDENVEISVGKAMALDIVNMIKQSTYRS